jgi:hypothetical protein
MKGIITAICVSMLLCFAAGGCGAKKAETSAARDDATKTSASAPAATPVEFAVKGVRLTYPSTWSTSPSDDYVLLLVKGRDASQESISVEIPKLPPHLPGMIPLGLVVNGYVNDMKKQHPGVAVSQPVPMRVDGAAAKRVRSKWGGGAEDAVLAVHGDNVYIFRASGLDAKQDDSDAAQAFIAVLQSVKWN